MKVCALTGSANREQHRRKNGNSYGKKRSVIVEVVRDFDTDKIFDCGQCFRWERRSGGGYLGTASGRQALKEYDGSERILTIHGSDEEDFEIVWRRYLDLDRDYGMIEETLSTGDEVKGADIEDGQGIRILNQDKWETLQAFLISQNNDIPRIKKWIEALAMTLGRPSGTVNGREFYELPDGGDPRRSGDSGSGAVSPGIQGEVSDRDGAAGGGEGIESLERLGSEEVSSGDLRCADAVLRRGTQGGKLYSALFHGKAGQVPHRRMGRKVMNGLYGLEKDLKEWSGLPKSISGVRGYCPAVSFLLHNPLQRNLKKVVDKTGKWL